MISYANYGVEGVKLKIVFVYLGKNIPSYVLDNLKYLRVNFPKKDIILVVDCSHKIDFLSNYQIKVWNSVNPLVAWSEVSNIYGHSQKFRDNFWFNSLARFYALYCYMSEFPSESVLHLEADVWLAPNFPFESFASIEEELAFPLANENEGLASTLFLKSLTGAKMLKEYAESLVKLDAKSTDIDVLGSIYKQFPNEVCVLPSMGNLPNAYHSHVSDWTKFKMSQNYNKFGGVFDPSTWGQFLTGKNPRNDFGFRILFFNQTHHAINVKKFTFHINAKNELTALNNENRVPINIFSLHVHSKDRRMFRVSTFANLLKQRIECQTQGTQKEFVLTTFISELPHYCIYTLNLLIKRFFNLFKNTSQ